MRKICPLLLFASGCRRLAAELVLDSPVFSWRGAIASHSCVAIQDFSATKIGVCSSKRSKMEWRRRFVMRVRIMVLPWLRP